MRDLLDFCERRGIHRTEWTDHSDSILTDAEYECKYTEVR